MPSAPGVKVARVSFTTEDGIRLSGRLFGQGKTGVVLCHMYPADQRSWWEFASLLAEKGYAALAFDFRGYGESEGKKEIAKIYLDVRAALKYLRDRGVEKAFLIGASMGGTAALMVAAEEMVSGVVTLSAPDAFRGLDARKAVKEVAAPKLFIAAEGDAYAAKSARFFYEQAAEPKTLHIFSGKAHGTDLFKTHGEELRDLILDFLEKAGAG